MALDDLAADDAASPLQAELQLQTLEEAWLEEAWAQGPRSRGRKRPSNVRTFYRRPSRQWLVMMDNMFRSPPRNGPGLKRVQLGAKWRDVKGDACLKWPAIGASTDQWPIGYAGGALRNRCR